MSRFPDRVEIDHPAAAAWPDVVVFEPVPLGQDRAPEVRPRSPEPLGGGTRIAARGMLAGREAGLDGARTDPGIAPRSPRAPGSSGRSAAVG